MNNKWDYRIKSKRGFLEISFKEIFSYSDLIYLFVRRDFVVFYKQTILGPLWFIIQPIVYTLVFNLIFGKIANISTDGIPSFLFYMSGTVTWSYFAICLNTTSNTFIKNSELFGKVYFPRLVVPISNVIFSILQFIIQFLIFIFFLNYFYYKGILDFEISIYVLLLPLLILQMALLGLGFGILISALTTKYRDLTFVMTFAVQIWMYLTPIVYPLSIAESKYRMLLILNPMTSVVECFRGIFFGISSIHLSEIFISIIITLSVFVVGCILFNKMEKNFMDTI